MKSAAVSRNALRWTKPGSGQGVDLNDFYKVLRGQFPKNNPLPKKRLAIAVSGGVDSLALCYLTEQMAQRKDFDFHGTTLYAFIINHGMREGSLEEAEAVARMLKQGIDNVIPRIATISWPDMRPKTELNARVNRYRLLAHLCKTWQCNHLLLGHHKDDSAETIVMRLVRDTGHRGLAGIADVINIPESEDIYNAHEIMVHRPLLGFTKAQLTTTLRESITRHPLTPVEDPTNKIPTFTLRNAVRSLFHADPCPLPPAFQVPSLHAFSLKMKKLRNDGDDLANAYVRLKCRLWPVREAAGTMLVKFPLDAFKEEEELLIRSLQNVAARLMPPRKTEWKRLQTAVRKLFIDNLQYITEEDLEWEDEVDEYESLELPGAALNYRSGSKPSKKFPQPPPPPKPRIPGFHHLSAEPKANGTIPAPPKPPSSQETFATRNKKAVRKLPAAFTVCGLYWQPYTSRRWLVSRHPIKVSEAEEAEIHLPPYNNTVMRKWVLFDQRMWLHPPKSLPGSISKQMLRKAGVHFPVPLTSSAALLARNNDPDYEDLFFHSEDMSLPISHYVIRPLNKDDLSKLRSNLKRPGKEKLNEALADMAPGNIRFTMPVVTAVIDEERFKAQRARRRAGADHEVEEEEEENKRPIFRTELETHLPVFRTALERSSTDQILSKDHNNINNMQGEDPVDGETERREKLLLEIPLLMPTLPPPMNLLPEIIPGRWYFKFRADKEAAMRGEDREEVRGEDS